MDTPRLPNKWVSLLIVAVLFLSPAILQGCDSFSVLDDDRPEIAIRDVVETKAGTKLRHPNLLESARKTAPGTAGKSGEQEVNLFLAFNEYEADGVTPRILNRYEITNRILQEYGITRRVLEKYGITKRVLNEYGVTRRLLNQYDVTRRILGRYGITPRVLSQYNGIVSDALLDQHQVSDAVLAAEGLTQAEIDDFNYMSSLLAENNLTIEEFVSELESALQTIRIKVYIEDAHLGVTIAIGEVYSDTFLEEIVDDPDILWAEPDVIIANTDLGTTSGAWYDKQIEPWGILAVEPQLPSFFGQFSEGYVAENPVHVYVLDSGAMPFSWLGDMNYVEKKDFTMLFENPDQLMWDDELAPDVSGFDPGDLGNPYDESGHGTHVAGTIGASNNTIGIVGVAPWVKIHSLKVLTKEGRTDVTTLLAAIDYVVRAKQENPTQPIVVNLSLGMDIGTTAYNVLDEAVEDAVNKGVIFVSAAGNDGRDAATYSPAHVDGVITVGSHDAENEFSDFSNYGSTVDILAPGENIVSLSHIVAEVQSFESILASGTSYATPHVTGAVARYLGDNPYASAAEVKEALVNSANNIGEDLPSSTTSLKLNVASLLSYDGSGSSSGGAGYGESDQENSYVNDDENAESSAVVSGYVLDEFNTVSYDGNNGTAAWAGSWKEIGESADLTNGKIRIGSYSNCASGSCLRIGTEEENRGIQRSINLSHVSEATLSFDYLKRDLEEDNLRVEVSSDGGASWNKVFRFGSGATSGVRSKTLDISPYASADTVIRFYVNGEEGEKMVYIDNVKVAYTVN